MKKLLVLAMVLSMTLGMVAVGHADVASDPKVTLVYAEVNPEDSLMGKTALVFKAKLEELTGGSVTIDLQASGVLGAENDVLDAMIGGTGAIDITRISAFSLTNSLRWTHGLRTNQPHNRRGRKRSARYWGSIYHELQQHFCRFGTDACFGRFGANDRLFATNKKAGR